jgi:hypothetical protein
VERFWKYFNRNSSDRLFSANFSCLWQLWICLQIQFNQNKLKGKWRCGALFYAWFIIWTFICDIKKQVWWFIMPWQQHLYSLFTYAMKYVKCELLSHILFSNDNKKADFHLNTCFISYIRHDFGRYDTICWLVGCFHNCLFVFQIINFNPNMRYEINRLHLKSRSYR